ncbi:non-hydrolyzing UDP-N-acetylglucosamine 2-epimerase [Kordiimonas sp. SCSIO 12610]|uniref:non-hydrolyzing UDP-N-acetylglucosamine 2-epimerase n=1 Tax=Kordiimonas sp. SCSIO 12610 TaxID=2829597 RepID=UPI0021091850|nr:UDP-N-acetylglucosamine 2-epimerase (non-hydrolyzing) [Kordiimonas sp. SCSIO 12610]UTW54405.1 UDP-N-acetylglucosamine 2-epimerase (non-hydrolyzing) [Kordiimonas sp. SCSIO 12610]
MKILTVLGTRPEAIKMAPVISVLAADPRFESKVCVTGQHRGMLDQVIRFFEINVDFDLNVMKENQSLADTTSAILKGLDDIIKQACPDLILVHGDTNTTLSASLAAYYNQVDIGHVEAGLRTHDLYSPWPEEGNRRITDLLSSKFFAPTELAKANLVKEGVEATKITVSGNTVVDALLNAKAHIDNNPALSKDLQDRYSFLDKNKRLILVTGHRRENFGKGVQEICSALQKIAKMDDIQIIYPVHRNPNIQEPVFAALQSSANIHLIPPLDYPDFVYLMNRSYLILTDSGGIQEEAPSLNKPVLVMRDVTERPEGLRAGTLKLVGTNAEKIVENVHTLLRDNGAYSAMANADNPYGDGQASKRIVDALYNDK